MVNFPILEDIFRKGRTKARETENKKLADFQSSTVFPLRPKRSKSSAPPIGRIPISTTCNSFLLHGIALPLSVSIQAVTQNTRLATMAIPWGNAIGPLNLIENHDLPKASRKNFPRFNGDGSVSAKQHLSAF